MCIKTILEDVKKMTQALRRRSLTCKQTSEETSCSKTPSEMTGKDVRITLNSNMYQSSYTDCPEKPVYASK